MTVFWPKAALPQVRHTGQGVSGHHHTQRTQGSQYVDGCHYLGRDKPDIIVLKKSREVVCVKNVGNLGFIASTGAQGCAEADSLTALGRGVTCSFAFMHSRVFSQDGKYKH